MNSSIVETDRLAALPSVPPADKSVQIDFVDRVRRALAALRQPRSAYEIVATPPDWVCP
jgi:hypothetical protein